MWTTREALESHVDSPGGSREPFGQPGKLQITIWTARQAAKCQLSRWEAPPFSEPGGSGWTTRAIQMVLSCLPGASQTVQLILSCLPGASQAVQLILSCLPGASRLSKWFFTAIVAPPWCLADRPIDPFLLPWCLASYPNGSFLSPWCLPGALQTVQLILPCLPGASQAIQMVLSCLPGASWPLAGCPIDPFVPPWCLASYLKCLLVPRRLSNRSFPASLLPRRLSN